MKKTIFLLCFSSLLLAENQVPPRFLVVNKVKAVTLKAGGKAAEVVVSVSIDPEFHIQANPVSQPNLIPTSLNISAKEGVEPGEVIYPTAKTFRLQNSDKDLAVYEGTAEIKIQIQAKTAKPGKYELDGFVKFQACNNQICFFPTKKEVKIPVQVVKR